MAKILFIIPDEDLLTFARETLKPSYPDIEVVAVIDQEGAERIAESVKIVQERIAQGLEVVAARAVIASAIRQAGLNIAVVEIPRTSFDIIRTLDEMKLHEKKCAFISYSEKIWGIEFFTEALGANIRQYTVSYKDDFDKEIMAACTDGAEVILGGFTVVKAAKRLNIPCALIKIGKESLLQAAREAKQIQEALEIEAAKRGVFGTILDYSYEGIVTIDKDQTITAFNPFVQKITNIDKGSAIGHSVDKIFPQLQLGKVMETGTDDLHRIISVGSARIMCNKVPIIVNGKPYGAVATLQDIGKIQEMEAKIRRQIYARGHIAKFHFEDIVGQSPCMLQAIETAKDFTVTNSSILISGETGTGKEIFAQSIHNASKRSRYPFVAINCAALPAQILESELFGYVGGAFTGANKEGKPGLFEVAHMGTIFLDEIAEMDYINQGRLLRFLQERTVVRLGSHNVIPIDVRIIAATNKDLELLVRENKFRDDLYFRLNVLNLELPPLKTRKADIRLYAQEFLKEFSAELGRSFRLTHDALQLLEESPWPGNVREFKNVMERIAATSKSDVVNRTTLLSMLKPKNVNPSSQSPKEARLIQEIIKALAASNGNYTAAAKILGISRTTLWRRMQKFQIAY
jgi:PAS domain S-box-containing protein